MVCPRRTLSETCHLAHWRGSGAKWLASSRGGSSCAGSLSGTAMAILGADALQVVAEFIVFVTEGGIALVARALVQIRFLPCRDKAPVGLLLVPLAVLRVEPGDVATLWDLEGLIQAAKKIKLRMLQ